MAGRLHHRVGHAEVGERQEGDEREQGVKVSLEPGIQADGDEGNGRERGDGLDYAGEN